MREGKKQKVVGVYVGVATTSSYDHRLALIPRAVVLVSQQWPMTTDAAARSGTSKTTRIAEHSERKASPRKTGVPVFLPGMLTVALCWRGCCQARRRSAGNLTAAATLFGVERGSKTPFTTLSALTALKGSCSTTEKSGALRRELDYDGPRWHNAGTNHRRRWPHCVSPRRGGDAETTLKRPTPHRSGDNLPRRRAPVMTAVHNGD